MNSNITWLIDGVFKADAKTVYSELNSIGKSYTPEEVVEFAKNENTELHKCFTWDNTVAAEKWRLQEARNVMRMLRIVPERKEEQKVIMTRAVVATYDKSGTYQPITTVVRNEDSYQKLLAQALKELESFKNKYKVLSELEGVFAEIENCLKTA